MDLSLAQLTQLRAFVTVARHLSFKQAADRLFVTQSALSHQVRQLEKELGVDLLKRLHRRIELTEPGRALVESCGVHMDGLVGAMRQLRTRTDADPLTVSVAPYFSAKWLTPRLGRLWSEHPGIDLQLRHAYKPADFLHDNVDLGISWGSGHWDNTDATLVLAGDLTPVCSAAFWARWQAEGATPRSLLKHRLFYEFGEAHWHLWFKAARVKGSFNGVQIDDSHALCRAVLDGHGVGLFFDGLIQEDLRLGYLVKPFDLTVNPGAGYYLVQPTGRPVGRKQADFTRWLAQEVRNHPLA